MRSQIDQLYASYWNGTDEIFTSINLSSASFEDISPLTGVTFLQSSTNTCDHENGRYFNLTNLGITTVDIRTGTIISTIPNPSPNRIGFIEYDSSSGNLFGLGSNPNGDGMALHSVDLNSGTISLVSTLPSIQGIANGNHTFDSQTGRYIVPTRTGVTIIDTSTGSILRTIPYPANTLKGLEYDCTQDRICGTYSSSGHFFSCVDILTGTYSPPVLLPGVSATINTNNTFDPITSRYFTYTNLGITVIDATTGDIISTIPVSARTLKGIAYCYKKPDFTLANTSQTLCEGSSFDLNTVTINGDFSGKTWHTSSPTTSANQLNNLAISPTSNTTYYVSVEDNNCSTQELSFTILLNNNCPFSISRLDPCSCDNPLNKRDDRNTITHFQDVLTITTGISNQTITLVNNAGEIFLNTNLVAISNNTVLGTTDANGILKVDFFTAKEASGSITISNGLSSQIINFFSCASNSCLPTTIPTMSEWGLSIFGLLTLNLGVVFLRRKEEMLE